MPLDKILQAALAPFAPPNAEQHASADALLLANRKRRLLTEGKITRVVIMFDVEMPSPTLAAGEDGQHRVVVEIAGTDLVAPIVCNCATIHLTGEIRNVSDPR